jgi:hypothetical protein
MSRFAFGLPYFLFGFGSALNTGEHVIWSINVIQNCPNTPRKLDIVPQFGLPSETARQQAIRVIVSLSPMLRKCSVTGTDVDACCAETQLVSLVALLTWRDLLFCAKLLFVAAILAGPPASHAISQGTGHHRADGPRQARSQGDCPFSRCNACVGLAIPRQ